MKNKRLVIQKKLGNMKMITKAVLFMILFVSPFSAKSQVDGCYEYEKMYEMSKGHPVLGQQVKEELYNCYLNEMEMALENNECAAAQTYYEKYLVASGDSVVDSQQKIWDSKRCVGCVATVNEGKKIFLMQQERNGVHTVTAYSLQGNQFEETKVFNVTKKHCSTIYSVKYDCWNSSNLNGDFFIFNKADSTLYIPLIDSVYWGQVCGSDRYIVYKFDGMQFALHNRNDGGFWLHPSLRNYKAFVAILRTPNHLIRIDETADKCRYAAWKRDAKMTDVPDLVLVDNPLEPQAFGFNNGSYDYVIDMNNDKLIIMKNGEMYREETFEVILYRDSNCW